MVEVHGRGVEHRDARPHPAVVQVDPHVPLGAGELGPVVDPGEAPVVVGVQRRDDPPVLAGERDEVREVQLARGRRRPEIADPASQPRRVDRVQARVDLGDLALLVGRVLVLDDPLDRPAVVAHDPAEAGRDRSRPRRRGRSPRGRGRAAPAARTAGRPGPAGRRPTRPGSPRRRRGARREPPPARRRCRGARPGASRRRAARRRRGPPRWPGSTTTTGRVPVAPRRGIEHVLDHRPPAHRVQHLGRRRLHARAEAGREDDRDRPARRASRDLRGSQGRALARSRPDRRLWYGSAGARMGVGVGHQEWPGFCGRASGGVNRRRRARPPRRVRAGSARRDRGRGRRRSRATARPRRRRSPCACPCAATRPR